MDEVDTRFSLLLGFRFGYTPIDVDHVWAAETLTTKAMDDSPPSEEHAHEGQFDAQMLFSTPFVEAPQPLTAIIKRDGYEAPFDKTKIAGAIYRAAETIGAQDLSRSESLASAVTIYLAKKANGGPPTVDQVNDAVERVLIEMGDGATALAFARYRDRRARVRRLRAGDAGGVLSEWAEAVEEPGGRPVPQSEGLFVRTSAETLTAWDRARIAEALVRETGLDERRADFIALEVEHQITSAQVTTLTSSLVRELVSAKLIEHGLEEHRRRHARLGVPLYDAERIICGPHVGAPGEPADPEATGRSLAESVKREFALAHVFSAEVADAHIGGDVHVHDLGYVDRLHGSVQSLQHTARFGLGLPGSRTFSTPPKYADTLLAQMVNSSLALQNHFAGTVGWYALNVFFAPFLQELGDKAVHQVAQMLVYEYAYRAVAHGCRGPSTEIGICWEMCDYLRNLEAAGPGGAFTGRMYAEYEHTSQGFASALLDVFKEGGARGAPFPAPLPVVRITGDFFRSPGHEEFLHRIAEVAALRGNIHVQFERGDCLPDDVDPWEPRETVVQRVTLNLPRAAYRSRNEDALEAELERLVETAVLAHARKRDFIEDLLAARELGPLGLLAVEREGRPFLNLPQARYFVGVTGLNECVQHVTGKELHESEEALALGRRLLARLGELCERARHRLGLNCAAVQTIDTNVSHRFASLDLAAFPEQARQTVKTDPATHDIFYTGGARVSQSADVNPMERARIEGGMHDSIHGDGFTLIRVPDSETSAKSIADFIRKAYHQTRCRRIGLAG